MCKYLDRNDSAPMLVAKMLAGVASDLNLSIPLHAGEKACKWGDSLWFWNPEETLPEVPDERYKRPHKKNWCPPKNMEKNTMTFILLQNHHEVQQDGILFSEEEQETTLHSAITHQEEGHEYSSLQRFTTEIQRSQYPDQEGRRGSGEGSVLFNGVFTLGVSSTETGKGTRTRSMGDNWCRLCPCLGAV